MIKLTPDEIKCRFESIYDAHIKTLGISGMAKAALATMLPQIPLALADESKQTELINIMEELAACIGRKAFFVWEDEVEYIQYIKAGSQA